MKVTAETITDEQIREWEAEQGDDWSAIDRSTLALLPAPQFADFRSEKAKKWRAAREHIAAAWNARHGGES